MDDPEQSKNRRNKTATTLIAGLFVLIAALIPVAVAKGCRASTPTMQTYSGIVRDPQGKPVPHAKVMGFQDQLVPETVYTDDNGVFHFQVNSEVKSFRIIVEAVGFSRKELDAKVMGSGPQEIDLVPIKGASNSPPGHMPTHPIAQPPCVITNGICNALGGVIDHPTFNINVPPAPAKQESELEISELVKDARAEARTIGSLRVQLQSDIHEQRTATQSDIDNTNRNGSADPEDAKKRAEWIRQIREPDIQKLHVEADKTYREVLSGKSNFDTKCPYVEMSRSHTPRYVDRFKLQRF
jgi:hypothetical protein